MAYALLNLLCNVLFYNIIPTIWIQIKGEFIVRNYYLFSFL